MKRKDYDDDLLVELLGRGELPYRKIGENTLNCRAGPLITSRGASTGVICIRGSRRQGGKKGSVISYPWFPQCPDGQRAHGDSPLLGACVGYNCCLACSLRKWDPYAEAPGKRFLLFFYECSCRDHTINIEVNS